MSLLEKRKFDGEAFGDVPSQQADSTGSLLDGEAEYAAGEGNIRGRRTDDARLMQSAGVSRADGLLGCWSGMETHAVFVWCSTQGKKGRRSAGMAGESWDKRTERRPRRRSQLVLHNHWSLVNHSFKA